MCGGDRLPKDVRGTPQAGPKRFRCGFLAKKSQEFIKRLSRQEKGKSCKVSLQARFSAFPGIALQRRCRPRLRLGTTEGEDGEVGSGGQQRTSRVRGCRLPGWPRGTVPGAPALRRGAPHIQRARGPQPHSPSVLLFASR